MRIFLRLSEVYNYQNTAFKSKNFIYGLILFQYLQLASVINTSQPAYLRNDDIMNKFFQVISYTSPLTWETIATTQGVLAVVGGALSINFLLNLIAFAQIFQKKEELNEYSKFVLLLSKFCSLFFEYLLLIPTFTWIFFNQMPFVFSFGEITLPRIKKSPNWFFILFAVILGINCSVSLLMKLVDFPFRNLFRDKLKTALFFYEMFHFVGVALIIILAAEAQMLQIRYLIPNVISVLYASLTILMEFLRYGHRNPTSRKFHIYITAAYLVHSIFLLVIGQLEQNFGKAHRRFFPVIYFFSLSFIIKACQKAIKMFLDSGYSVESRGCFKTASTNKKFEEMLNILNQAESVELFLKPSSQPILIQSQRMKKALFRQKELIFEHISSCQSRDCFCSSLQQLDSISSSQSSVVGNIELLPLEIIESYYQQLLKTCADKKKYDFWILITYVLFQALDRQNPIKGCLILQRFRSPNLSQYEKIILNSLILFLRDLHKNSLGNIDQGLPSVSLLDGLTLDTKFQKIQQAFTKLQKIRCEFYKYLIEANPVDLNKLFNQGKDFTTTSNWLETRLEKLYKKNGNNIDIITLLLEYRLSVIGSSKTTLRSLTNNLHYLRLQNRFKKDESNGQNGAAFDFLDSKNVFLAIELVNNVGELINHSSNLWTHIKRPKLQTKLTLKEILPSEIGGQILLMLPNYLSQPKTLENATKYIDLLFLSDNEQNLLPYKGCFKAEFMLERVICASAALKKLHTASQFFLTKPSGEVMATTNNINAFLGIETSVNVLGMNICLVMPKLLDYYLDKHEKTEDLYPHQNYCSIKFNALACVDKQYILETKNANNFSETGEILTILNGLNRLGDKKTLDLSQLALIEEKIGKLKKSFGIKQERVYEVTVKIRKWDINRTSYKVLEISNCNRNYRQTKKLVTKNGRQYRLTTSSFRSETMAWPKDEGDVFGENNDQQIPEEAANDKRFSNRSMKLEPFLETGTPPPNMAKKTNLIRFGSRDTIVPEIITTKAPNREGINDTLGSFEPFNDGKIQFNEGDHFFSVHTRQSVEVIKQIVTNQPQADRFLKSPHFVLEQNAYLPQQEADLLSVSAQKDEELDPNVIRGGSEDGDDDESKKFDRLDNSSGTRKHLNRASTSQATPTEGTGRSFTITEAIQSNPIYRIVRINFFVGLLGVAIIVALFTAQYAGYRQRLNETVALIRSISYPMEIATHEVLQFKEYRKWEFFLWGYIPYSVDFWAVGQIISLAYQNIVISYTQLIMNPQNVSQSVNFFLSDPENQIQMTYLDGKPQNMSLLLALMTHSEAFEINYNYVELKNQSIGSLARNDYVIEWDANPIYDTLVNMTAYLNTQIQYKTELVRNFNVSLLVVVAIVIFGIDICCIIMYQSIHFKKKKMLSLFCKVSKAELTEEYQRLNSQITLASKAKNGPEMLAKRDPKRIGRVLTSFKYHNARQWITIVEFTFVLSLFLAPFVAIFSQTALQLNDLTECVDQVNTWVGYEAALAGLYFQNYHYFSNVNSTDEDLKASIHELKLQRLENYKNHIPSMQDLIFTWGKLPNQGAFDAASTTQISGGIQNICKYNNHPDPRYNLACGRAANGIGNSGILQVADYFLVAMESIYWKIYNSTNQSQAFIQACQDISFTDSDTIGIALNRYLRITSDMIIYSIGNHLNSFNDVATRTFVGVLAVIVLVLGIGWILWIRRMHNLLNETKNIFKVLPSQILNHTAAIGNYFKQELQPTRWGF